MVVLKGEEGRRGRERERERDYKRNLFNACYVVAHKHHRVYEQWQSRHNELG